MQYVKVRERMLARNPKSEQPEQSVPVAKKERDYTALDDLPRFEPIRPRTSGCLAYTEVEIREDSKGKRLTIVWHNDRPYGRPLRGRRGSKKPKYKTHPNHRRL